jgi:hypothetical protein
MREVPGQNLGLWNPDALMDVERMPDGILAALRAA